MMRRVGQKKGCSTMVSRRDFLRVGSLSVMGLSVADQAALARFGDGSSGKSCIFLLMTGGPSQLETFDPKPVAPSRIRGPLRAISTSVPGVFLSESLPCLAQRAHKFALVRSLWHDAAPIHETGYQLLQTGRLARNGRRFPSIGSVAAATSPAGNGVPAYVVLPRLLDDTGVDIYRGQQAGFLGGDFDPVVDAPADDSAKPAETPVTPISDLMESRFEEAPESVRRAFGDTDFGKLCWQASQLVECGVRCVVVNLFTSLSHQITWDCHANNPTSPATLYDYRDTLCPAFDQAVSALIDNLDSSGLLQDTLLVATGEFGRTPQLNDRGGRDHWTRVWSALIAGAGVRGGQVIGASDTHGGEPVDRPIRADAVTATIYRTLGFDLQKVSLSDNGTEFPLVESEAIGELFA